MTPPNDRSNTAYSSAWGPNSIQTSYRHFFRTYKVRNDRSTHYLLVISGITGFSLRSTSLEGLVAASEFYTNMTKPENVLKNQLGENMKCRMTAPLNN